MPGKICHAHCPPSGGSAVVLGVVAVVTVVAVMAAVAVLDAALPWLLASAALACTAGTGAAVVMVRRGARAVILPPRMASRADWLAWQEARAVEAGQRPAIGQANVVPGVVLESRLERKV